jgi:hypothetical protein
MPTSPTSQSALLSGAAKDDVVGLTGTTFTIADLLSNDPGGAAKVNVGTQFFFGSTAADQANQAGYLAAHNITNNGDGTYTINDNSTDFQYFVQIGNKGTWSQADVEVNTPEAKGHLGDSLFTENFDGYTEETQTTYFDPPGTAVFASVDLNAASGWTGAQNSELGADGYGSIPATSGTPPEAFWLDTQNSPGPINISHTFTDTTAPVDGTTSVLSFDIAKQSLDYLGNHYETAADAKFEFKIDGATVATVNAADLTTNNQMTHFDIPIDAYVNPGTDHLLTLVDTSADASFTGFSVDSIQIHDWTV